MHELSITRNIVAIVSERAKGAKVTRVTLEIGKLSAVMPDAIRFCFEIIAKGTVVEEAVLDIIEIPGRGRCRACGGTVDLPQLAGRCDCGSPHVELVAGEELLITQMVTV